MADQSVSFSTILACYRETEPVRIASRHRLRQNDSSFETFQPFFEMVEILLSGRFETIYLLQLGTTDGGLKIRCLQIETHMGIDILVIETERKRTELLREPLPAHIILPGRTCAVSAPIPQGAHYPVQKRVIGVRCSALTRCDVVRGIETGSSYISDGTCVLQLTIIQVFRTQ